MTMINEHLALFPSPSVNVYDTSVEPIGNKSPGLWDWLTVGTEPESSMAEGSIHVMLIDV